MLEEVTVDCPYCGEAFEAVVDQSAGAQQYVEDCYVCCRPIIFEIVPGPGGEPPMVTTRREDD